MKGHRGTEGEVCTGYFCCSQREAIVKGKTGRKTDRLKTSTRGGLINGPFWVERHLGKKGWGGGDCILANRFQRGLFEDALEEGWGGGETFRDLLLWLFLLFLESLGKKRRDLFILILPLDQFLERIKSS